MINSEFHAASMAVIRSQPRYSDAARRLAYIPAPERTVSPGDVMAAIWCGWFIAHALGAFIR